MKFLFYIIVNGVFAVSTYFACFEDNLGAENIMLFFVWFTGLISFIFLTKEGKRILTETPRSIPSYIDITFDICIFVCLLYFGYVISGILYFLHIIIIVNGIRKEVGTF